MKRESAFIVAIMLALAVLLAITTYHDSEPFRARLEAIEPVYDSESGALISYRVYLSDGREYFLRGGSRGGVIRMAHRLEEGAEYTWKPSWFLFWVSVRPLEVGS